MQLYDRETISLLKETVSLPKETRCEANKRKNYSENAAQIESWCEGYLTRGKVRMEFKVIFDKE